MRDLPCVLVPGGVMLLPEDGEDTGKVQIHRRPLRPRRNHAGSRPPKAGCRACAIPGGGCQFLGTAATSQVVGEALGLSLPHSALAPSGQPIWLDMARRSARALLALEAAASDMRDILTEAAIRNAMVGPRGVRRLHQSAAARARHRPRRRPAPADGGRLDAHQSPGAAPGRCAAQRPDRPPDRAGLPRRRRARGDAAPPPRWACSRPRVPDRDAANRSAKCSTGGSRVRAPHRLCATCSASATASIRTTSSWSPTAPATRPDLHRDFPARQPRPRRARSSRARRSTPRVVDADGVYRKTGPARVFRPRRRRSPRSKTGPSIQGRRRLVLICRGPMGSGMEEIYQVTSALQAISPGASRWRCSPMPASPASRPAPASAMSPRKRWPAARSASCATATWSKCGSIA